jgi:hypothetical protein
MIDANANFFMIVFQKVQIKQIYRKNRFFTMVGYEILSYMGFDVDDLITLIPALFYMVIVKCDV